MTGDWDDDDDEEPVEEAVARDPYQLPKFPVFDGDQSWRKQAACRGTDPALFFPEQGNPESMGALRALCGSCPVSVECYEAGLNERHGVWGGSTERERRRERVARRETPKAIVLLEIVHGTAKGYAMEQARGLETCVECRAAHRERQNAYIAARRVMAGLREQAQSVSRSLRNEPAA